MTQSLWPSISVWGSSTLIESGPVAKNYRDVIYMPINPSVFLDSFPRWGLFTQTGTLIEEAAYYRLAEHVLIGQQAHISDLPNTLSGPSVPYIYGGPIIMHFGHFVTTALARLWPIVCTGLPKGARILVHSHQSPEQWFEYDYIRTLLGSLGLGPDDFARFDQPTKLASVMVPRPAFEEQNFVHRVFGDLCRDIGTRLGIGNIKADDGPPVYLSKSQHTQGTTRLINEGPLEHHLAEQGIEIVHPQNLPFSEQLRILSRASAVVCTLGSGLHSALFCPEPKRILALSMTPEINSNYCLIDKLCGNSTLYVHSPMIRPSSDASSTFTYEADNPAELGAGLHALLKDFV